MAKITSNPFLDWYNSGALTVSKEQGKAFKKHAKELIEEAEKMLEIDEKDYLALFQVAMGYFYSNKVKEAITYFEKAIKVEEEPRLLFYYAYCLALGNKNLEKAERILVLLPEEYQKEAAFYNLKGIIADEQKQFEKAIEAYDRAIELEPEYANIWYNKGISLYDLQRYEEAITAYDQAIELDPEDVRPWNNKGFVLKTLKRYEEAIRAYDRAIAVGPEDVRPWNNKGNALKALERYEEAITAYDRAIDLEPEDATAWNNKGITLHDLKRYKEAIECFQKVIQYGEDWDKELARQRIEDLKTKVKVHGYSDLEETINQIEKHLSHGPEAICHYTRQQISYLVLLCIEGKHDRGDQDNASPFQISAGSFLNDPSEGQILETFLGIDTGNIEQSNYESQFAAKPFIGSFVPADLYNDLNLWRMYGDEAKGCSITFRLRDFQQALYDQLPKSPLDKGEGKEAGGKVQEKGPKDLFPCYWVAYYDRKKGSFCIPGQESLEKELNHLMEELKERYQEMLEKQEAGSTLPITITERLNDIAYLFKLSEYKAEQEIRLIVNPALFPKQFEFGYGGHRVFMSTVSIRNLTTRICLGPKMPEANQFASLLHYHFEQDVTIKDKPEIILSHLPYQ